MTFAAQRRVLALCCRCGRQRRLTIWTTRRLVGEVRTQVDYDRGADRCLARRFCRACRRRANHAFLRLPDSLDRDDIEIAMLRHHGSFAAYRLARARVEFGLPVSR